VFECSAMSNCVSLRGSHDLQWNLAITWSRVAKCGTVRLPSCWLKNDPISILIVILVQRVSVTSRHGLPSIKHNALVSTPDPFCFLKLPCLTPKSRPSFLLLLLLSQHGQLVVFLLAAIRFCRAYMVGLIAILSCCQPFALDIPRSRTRIWPCQAGALGVGVRCQCLYGAVCYQIHVLAGI